jgi:hypothetical protein
MPLLFDQAQNRLFGSFGFSEVNQPQNFRRFVFDHVIFHVCLDIFLKSLLVTVYRSDNIGHQTPRNVWKLVERYGKYSALRPNYSPRHARFEFSREFLYVKNLPPLPSEPTFTIGEVPHSYHFEFADTILLHSKMVKEPWEKKRIPGVTSMIPSPFTI